MAFYTGWANAMDAVAAAKDVFKSRNIGADQLPPASGPQLPLDEAAEAQRATRVGEQFGKITPSLVQYTTDVLFRDLWLRPGLAPRDRSLVTVSALVATGQVAQITYHLNRAMDNGLTKEEAGEVVGHLAFYAGWPNAFSAAPVRQGSHREAAPVAMSTYSRRQAIVLVAGFAASAALDARAEDSNMQRNAVMDIDIKRNGSRPSTKGNSDWFTGSVRVDPLFQAPDPATGERRPGHLRTRRPDGVAHASARPDADRHRRSRMGAARGRTDRGDPRRRRRLVSAGPEALARRFAHDGHDAHRHPGIPRRKERRLDGEGRRRPVPEVRFMMRGWDGDELRKIAEADDLHVSPFRADGTTYGTPTWIWSVAVDGALYVRGLQRTGVTSGTGPLCGRRPGGSSPPASPRK